MSTCVSLSFFGHIEGPQHRVRLLRPLKEKKLPPRHGAGFITGSRRK
ncbi:hypothetical protein [Corynebacterium aquilae]|nr:hypothetical protein [Corynebacterium aquilae]